MKGKYVIARCSSAGVHAGVLESHSGQEVVLMDSRRLWYWKCAESASFLSGVATAGITNASKVGRVLPEILLTDACEIIPCSEKSEKSIREIGAYGEK